MAGLLVGGDDTHTSEIEVVEMQRYAAWSRAKRLICGSGEAMRWYVSDRQDRLGSAVLESACGRLQ